MMWPSFQFSIFLPYRLAIENLVVRILAVFLFQLHHLVVGVIQRLVQLAQFLAGLGVGLVGGGEGGVAGLFDVGFRLVSPFSRSGDVFGGGVGRPLAGLFLGVLVRAELLVGLVD